MAVDGGRECLHAMGIQQKSVECGLVHAVLVPAVCPIVKHRVGMTHP